MTPEAFHQLERNLKDAKLRKQNRDRTAGIPASNPQRNEGGALDGQLQREEARWYGTAKRFEIIFRVYAVRPADYDGYDIKPMQDMVVRSQIIPDDKWNVLVGRTIPEKVRNEAEERTEIEIIAL